MKWLIVVYFILNICSTFLLTSSFFNPSIVTFSESFINYVTSSLGNFIILLLFLSIGMCFIKSKRMLVRYLIIVTFLLNIFLFLLGYFTVNFKTMLSFNNLTLFRNPNAGFAYQVVIDGLEQMIFSIQVLFLIPTIVMLLIFLIFKKKITGKHNFKIRGSLILLLISLISSFSIFTYFKYKLEKNWPYRVEVSEYGVEVCGVYNYYFSELVLGFDYSENYYNNITEFDIELYNKNNSTNVNIIDGQTYDRSNAGVLNGMNLFVIQAEALSNFVISYEYNNKLLMPYMNDFISKDNVYYFSNMYTSVGLGNTSDAEFAMNTGVYPLGDLTINWEIFDNMFKINSLSKMFSESYLSYSYNPTIEGFYAHKYVHENFYGFNKFSGFETVNSIFPIEQFPKYYLHDKWVSDEVILNVAMQDSLNAVNQGNNFYTFAQTISPHYPFVDISSRYSRNFEMITFNGISKKFSNYLNQINYIDKVLYDFLLEAQDTLSNTVFIIYGDHGNSLSKKEFEKLYSRKLTDFEYQRLLLQIPAIIYDPSGRIDDYLKNKDIDVDKMLSRTLSQIDLYSTIEMMFNLENEITFGVNMLSNEPSFAINPKSLDIIGDGFSYIVKNNNYYLDGLTYQEMINIVDRIKRFKAVSDMWLTLKMKREFV